jgi:hypothetical protein
MHKKRTHLFTLIAIWVMLGLFAAPTMAQAMELQTVSATLGTPADGGTLTSFSCTFTYTPTLLGDDHFVLATLYLNGTSTAATNQTAIANATENQISYTFAENGTYLWTILIQNSSHSVFAHQEVTVKVEVPPPTPTASPSQEPSPTETPTPTPSPTTPPPPTPTPPAPPPPKPPPPPQHQPPQRRPRQNPPTNP